MADIIMSIVGIFASVILCILTIAINRLFKRFDEVKADARTTESRLTGTINEVKADMTKRFDEVKADMTRRFDEAKADMTKRFDEAKTDVTKRFDEVKTDIETTEGRLTGSINEVKTDVRTDIKEVANRLHAHEDKCADRDLQIARMLGNLETAVTGKVALDKEET